MMLQSHDNANSNLSHWRSSLRKIPQAAYLKFRRTSESYLFNADDKEQFTQPESPSETPETFKSDTMQSRDKVNFGC